MSLESTAQEYTNPEIVLIKKKLQHKCLSVNIAKFLRTSILKNICERLLLLIRIMLSRDYVQSLRPLFSIKFLFFDQIMAL